MVQKAISNMVDNSKYEFMGYQAEARAVADQLLFLNGVCRHEHWFLLEAYPLTFLNGVCRHEQIFNF